MKKNKDGWLAHGTTYDIKNPGTYWSAGTTIIFTPAPYNCRRIAQEFADNKYLHDSKFARTVAALPGGGGL